MRERRFRAYCVGIAKTGTTSIAGILSKYRAAHEFMFLDAEIFSRSYPGRLPKEIKKKTRKKVHHAE